MSYVEQSLGANEAVHYNARYPTGRYVAAWILLIAGVMGAVLFAGFGHTVFAGLSALAGLICFAWILYRPWTSEIAVTNLRLIYKRGFLQRRTNDLQLRAIEEVRLKQDLWGRLLNFGHVEFYGTGVADLKLPAINDPVAFQKAIQEALGADKDETQNPGQLIMPSSQAS
ncbi:MAG: PH domain-containing protein [Hyphomicrobium sp.]|uniref:PH domain-containing protein n=1 Tax=Hyphomicrobium sp. TaxID=82 RepID=UPI0039E3C2E6